MYCPNCGNKIDDNAESCPICMFQVTQVKAQVNQLRNIELAQRQQQPTVNTESSKVNVNLKIVVPAVIIYTLFIGFLIFIYGGTDFSFSTDPIDTFKSSLKKNGFVEVEEGVYSKTKDGYTYSMDFNDLELEVEGNGYSVYYSYETELVYYVGTEKMYSIEIAYDVSTGKHECETNPATYSVYCSQYVKELRETLIDFQKTATKFLDNYDISVEELKEASNNE